MDTPGLGDTNGHKQDDDNVDNILKTVSNTPDLNSIVIMMNGTDPRITNRVQYVIQKIKGILPNVVKDNLVILMSNVST
jgi:hypothetical protein